MRIQTEEEKMQATLVKAAIGGILVIFLYLTTVNFVNAGERGVITEFGKPVYTVGEGISLRVPIVNGIQIMNVRTQKYQVAAQAASKDLQDVNSDIAINYRLLDGKVLETYRDVGTPSVVEAVVIAPALQESVKASTAKYNAEDLIGKRESVRNSIEELLKQKLVTRGIVIEAVSIVDFKFSAAYTTAIEQKQVAQQNAQKAVNVLQQVQVEAEQKIAQAQGEANATLTKAQAEANALRIQGQAIKENKDVVTLRTIEKWDGHLPQFLVGENAGGMPVSLLMNVNATQ